MQKAIVFKVEKEMLSAHPNATKLQILNFDGVEICVGLNTQVGDVCMYFPVDTKIEDWFLKSHNLYRHSEKNDDTTVVGFFEDNGRVNAIKLRGTISLGFIYTPTFVELSKWKLEVGESYDFVDGVKLCEKYYTTTELKIQKENNRIKKVGKKVKNNFSVFFRKHTETPNLFEYIGNLNVGDELILTLKLHGTSGRTGNLPSIIKWNWKELLKFNFRKFFKKQVYSLQTGSRNQNLYNDYFAGKADEFYKSNFREKIHEMFSKSGVKEGELIYYEIVGYTNNGAPIQKIGNVEFSYGLLPTQCDIYVYKIEKMLNKSGLFRVLTFEEMQRRCEELGVNCVPVLEKVIYESKEQLLSILKDYDDKLSKNDPIGHHLCEGVVIRVADRWKVCKYKFREFCFLENIQSTEDKFNMENIS